MVTGCKLRDSNVRVPFGGAYGAIRPSYRPHRRTNETYLDPECESKVKISGIVNIQHLRANTKLPVKLGLERDTGTGSGAAFERRYYPFIHRIYRISSRQRTLLSQV